MAEKTYEERMQELRAGIPQGGTKSGKATTSEPTPTDTELVTSKIAAAQRRADDRAAAEAAGVLGPLRPPKTKMPKSTYKGKTPADAVPRFIESLLGEEGVERSKQEEGRDGRRTFMEQAMAKTNGGKLYDYSDVLDLMRSPLMLEHVARRAALADKWGAELLDSGPDLLADDLASKAELEINPDVNVNYDDPQAIADAADDHAAQYIYKDIPGEDVPDAAAIDYEREQDNPNRAATYTGDGPGGEGTVYFYEMSGAGGGGQRGYWVRDDGSVVNVTNILLPPSAR